jgi:hypothetical protein
MKRIIIILVPVALIGAGCQKITSGGGISVTTSKGQSSNPPSVAGGVPSLRKSYENTKGVMQHITKLLEGVKDEASAKAAAEPLRKANTDLSAAVKEQKQVAAALVTAGQQQQITEFYHELADKGENPVDFAQMQTALIRVAQGPQAMLLRKEINALWDTILENVPPRQREGLQGLIESQHLRP